MQLQVATFVYDPFKPPPEQSQIYGLFATQIRHVCVCDYMVHQSYICDVVGAHDVCFTIYSRPLESILQTNKKGSRQDNTLGNCRINIALADIESLYVIGKKTSTKETNA